MHQRKQTSGFEHTDVNCVVFVTYRAWKQPRPGTHRALHLCSNCGMCVIVWCLLPTHPGSSHGQGPREVCVYVRTVEYMKHVFLVLVWTDHQGALLKGKEENKLAQNRVWSPREGRNLLTCLAPTSWLSQQQLLGHSDHEGLQEGRQKGGMGSEVSQSREQSTLSLNSQVLTPNSV